MMPSFTAFRCFLFNLILPLIAVKKRKTLQYTPRYRGSVHCVLCRPAKWKHVDNVTVCDTIIGSRCAECVSDVRKCDRRLQSVCDSSVCLSVICGSVRWPRYHYTGISNLRYQPFYLAHTEIVDVTNSNY